MLVADIIRIIGIMLGIVTMIFGMFDNVPRYKDTKDVKKEYKGKDLILYNLSCITGVISLFLLLVSFVVKF